jgi:hypothetical protein
MAVNLFALPASSVALLFSLVVGLTDAIPWAEPAETLAHRGDEWSPRPTGIPNDPSKLFKRSSLDVAICGWLGGNEALPAQCSSGSSCIHDTIHGVVGCCTTDGACQQGVYTSCLDHNSGGWASTAIIKNDGVTMWYVKFERKGKIKTDNNATALEPRSATRIPIQANIFNTRAEIHHQQLLSQLLMLASQMT